MKVLIIVPAFNEEKAILETIKSISEYPEYDCIVINDGSTDKTEQILTESNIAHITLLQNLGIGGAMQTGYKYAADNQYDIAVQVDADGQHKPEYIKDLIKELNEGNIDIVIGSRYLDKKGFQSTALRRFGKGILTALIRLFTQKVITDPTSGFRVCNKEIISIFSDKYPVDYPEPETILELLLMGKKIKEAPVVMNERAKGKSSITPIKSAYYMLKVSIALVFAFLTTELKGDKK